jgi:hypothetical protein
MLKYKSMTFEKYGGHYGKGDSAEEALESLAKVMRKDGTKWHNVTAFVLVSWEEDLALPEKETLLLAWGAYNKYWTPDKVIAAKVIGPATIKKALKVA